MKKTGYELAQTARDNAAMYQRLAAQAHEQAVDAMTRPYPALARDKQQSQAYFAACAADALAMAVYIADNAGSRQ